MIKANYITGNSILPIDVQRKYKTKITSRVAALLKRQLSDYAYCKTFYKLQIPLIWLLAKIDNKFTFNSHSTEVTNNLTEDKSHRLKKHFYLLGA